MGVDIEQIKNRLKGLGYDTENLNDGDSSLISYLILKIEQKLKNNLCQEVVPEAIQYVWIDMVCGEFLRELYSQGKLTESSYITTGSLASIKAGDMEQKYGTSSNNSTPLMDLIDHLCNSHQDELNRWRKLAW